MSREVTGADGISWSCVEAHAGLSGESGGEAAARAAGGDLLAVVCTPSGGAKSVRLELPAGGMSLSTTNDSCARSNRAARPETGGAPSD